MNAAIKSPDVRDLARESLPAGVFPPGAPEFRVFFNPQTHGDILKHGSEDTSVEICGVLVGKIEKDGQGPFVSITNSIRGEAAESKFAEVTFTHQSWNKINAEMDSKYQNLRIVGWYHTHPSFGIFLSDRDRFIQEHFFNGPGQIAHVVDPVQKIEGVFTWQNGRPELCSAYWVGNETKSAPPPSSATGMAFGPATVGAPEANSSPAPPESGRDMLWWAIALLTFMLGFLLANFMATRLNDWEKLSLARAHVKSFLIWKVVKPDLDTNLSLLSTELGKTTKAAQQLASEHLKLTAEKDRETVKKHWDDVLHNLEVIDEAQRTMIQVYGLTGLEKQMVLRELAEIDARERELLKREEQKAAETKEDAQPKKSSNSEGSGSAGTR